MGDISNLKKFETSRVFLPPVRKLADASLFGGINFG
jgi:hypothetical protein